MSNCFPVDDQKAVIFDLVEQVIAFMGDTGSLSDCGINLQSKDMLDMCELLGVRKLNITPNVID